MHIFKVKQDKNAVAVEHSVQEPLSLNNVDLVDDWGHLVEGNTEQIHDRIIDLAMADWTVKCQAFLRKNPSLDASDFRYGAKVSRTRVVIQKVRIDATEQKLNREQIDGLTSAGAEVYNIPEELI